jgi:hypothetical protein
MAYTNIRLLARKIEALDPQAQHAVEVAVDSLLNDEGLGPSKIVDSRIAMLERRVDALGGQTGGDAVVFLDERVRDHPDLMTALECLIDAAQRTLDVLVSAEVAQDK